MKTTRYFDSTRTRADRTWIREEWIEQTLGSLDREERQADGRIRRWKRIEAAENCVLRVILLEDGQTVHNALFDQGVP